MVMRTATPVIKGQTRQVKPIPIRGSVLGGQAFSPQLESTSPCQL